MTTIYFNAEPSTVVVSGQLRTDDGPVYPFSGTQHVVIEGVPESMVGKGHGGYLDAAAPGYAPKSFRVNISPPGKDEHGNLMLDTLRNDDADPPGRPYGTPFACVLEPVTVEPARLMGVNRGQIRPAGNNLVDASGAYFPIVGYTCHTALVEVAHGRSLDPIFDEMLSYGTYCPNGDGFNTLVCLGMFMGEWYDANGFHLDPRDPAYRSYVRSLFDQAAARNVYVFIRVLQSAHGLSADEQKAAWRLVCEEARGRWNVLCVAVGNEAPANGYDPQGFERVADMQGTMLSKGSMGIDIPPPAGEWDITEWEPPRSPIPKSMGDSSAGVLYLVEGYDGAGGHVGPFARVFVGEPIFFDDDPKDLYGDDRCTDPKVALWLGLGAGAFTLGTAFGSGKSLVCLRNGPGAAECARQVARGVRYGFQR